MFERLTSTWLIQINMVACCIPTLDTAAFLHCRILAELPRSLSEVAMQAGNPQHQGHAGGNDGSNEGVLNAEPDT